MKRFVLTICFVVLLVYNLFAQSYGLRFYSHESLPEKRTALELAPLDSLKFAGDVKLVFDMNFVQGHEIYFGYVLRIINGRQNIDIIYDQPTAMFRVITGQKFSGISFSIDSAHLFNRWNTITVLMEPSKQKLQLFVNNKNFGSANVSFNDNSFKFLWGANDYNIYQTRDIPPMRVKDIKLFDKDELKYYWPLDEVAGNASIDVKNKRQASIKNPDWIKPAHQNWSLINSFLLNGNAITAFDQQSQLLYIAASDSVLTYSLKTAQNAWQCYPVKTVNLLPGSQAIYDTITKRLLDVFIDEKKVIVYKPGHENWIDSFYDSLPTEYGHANKFINKADTSLYIIGGYGQLKYKNLVQRYSITKKSWEILKTKGDFFPPRYLSALGLNANGDTAFIIGGYGSPSGEQMLQPGNYSDMYAFDIKSQSFKKLFSLDTIFSKYTFANSLIIDSKNQQYYGLVFPNDSFNSNLQLIQGSLIKPTVKFLASKIPYSFYDAQSFADLYYSPAADKLLAVTIFGPKFESKDKYSSVKIYSLDFPPDTITGSESPTPEGNTYPVIIFSVLALTIVTFFIAQRKKKTKAVNPVVPATPETIRTTRTINETLPEPSLEDPHPQIHHIESHYIEERKMQSAVLLFGQFQVFDKESNDITELFTPLIKELFLLIVIYTFRNGRGITSEELNEILWSNKSVKDAKNNRSVNMTKLKNIVERVGNCTLAKKSNFWQFQVSDDPVYIDYVEFKQLLKEITEIDKEHIRQILKIASKGSFLSQTEYGWLDDVKAEVSNFIIDTCHNYLARVNVFDDAEFVIEIANCIFYFDRLNEDALEYKCKSLIYLKRHALANKTYTKFVKEYKDMYGEDFDKSFSEIIKSNSHTHI